MRKMPGLVLKRRPRPITGHLDERAETIRQEGVWVLLVEEAETNT